MNNQEVLVRNVLEGMSVTPLAPSSGRYLSLEAAQDIVDSTIDVVRAKRDDVEHAYLTGHRVRLATTLTMIPYAESASSSCLDVGCYGYMAYWMSKHLGYKYIEGIEWLPESSDGTMVRKLRVGEDEFEFTVHNFDISQSAWPHLKKFDTVIFLETLEHINNDPCGVLTNVVDRLVDGGALVMSVPNGVSYKTLQEFLMGAPPWTYWFFKPDLAHEPRHCFEYTPLFFKIILAAAGLRETAFRTICAYTPREQLDDIFQIGQALSIEPRFFGETMIAQARKDESLPTVRYPDCIYDGAAYYSSTYPLLIDDQKKAIALFLDDRKPKEGVNTAAMSKLEARAQAAEVRLQDSIALCNSYLSALEFSCSRASAQKDDISRLTVQVQTQEANSTRLHTELNDHVQNAIRLRAELASAHDAFSDAASRFHAINGSTFWRVSGPLRRALQRNPGLKSRVRALLGPVARLVRRVRQR